MQDVRREDHVERMRLEALLARVLLDVEELVADEGHGMELLLCMCEQGLRPVAVDIRRAIARELAQYVAGHPPGPAADLQDPHSAPLGQTLQRARNSLLRQQVVDPVR